jgi:glycine/D-amino acid oxidase-like deaminating enzyme/nitrite reductase/ring-hydroxylating ferredoxin subunit
MSDRTESLWRATHQLPRFTELPGDARADVAIVGAGISGLTAAVVLAHVGQHVVVLDRGAVGAGESGNTTSHLTEAVDARYARLIRSFGTDGAQMVARSNREAIDWIERFVGERGVECGFTRVPGFLYSEHSGDLEVLADELDAARRSGCSVRWVDEVPLPFRTRGGVRWDHQAQVHATAYLHALLDEALHHGVRVYTHTPVVGVHDGEPCRVETENGEVRAEAVFVAANVPVNNRVWLQTKIAAYRSYAIAVDLAQCPAALDPRGSVAQALFWDTDDPYHYTRMHRIADRSYILIGGEDHRTGTETDNEESYRRLLEYARERFGIADAAFRWSGQIIEPVDGLPYIGLNTASRSVYVATGFSGNGITFGTLAGRIVSDLISDQHNEYAELYAATRVKPLSSAYNYMAENVLFPSHLVRDRLTSLGADSRQVESLQRGEGSVFATEQGRTAICRDRAGFLHSVSAVCTHLACNVAWNMAEQTWDCPCHGSRFTPDGKVLNGPAISDLPARLVPATLQRDR